MKTISMASRSRPSRGNYSRRAESLGESITHGTKARVLAMNRELEQGEQVIDLSIGTLDEPTDVRIDQEVERFLREQPAVLHEFAPVKGFPFLRQSLAGRLKRLHGVEVDPETELMITPGGIKGALTLVFHLFLDPGDEVLIPVPNWPHYPDMVRLHGAVPRQILPSGVGFGLTPEDLSSHLTPETRMVILGDCINPTGKVYSTTELQGLAAVVAEENVSRKKEGRGALQVIFDCPYEAHILGQRPQWLAALEVEASDGSQYAMKECTVALSGPGKTYGMHGDRVGYFYAKASTVDLAARVQVNTNSFASTYGQVSTHAALQEELDAVASGRAARARSHLQQQVERLRAIPGVRLEEPQGGYFLFVDLSHFAADYRALGYHTAAEFLLQKGRVATISGSHFAPDKESMKDFVRINCGRSAEWLSDGFQRIEQVLTDLAAARSRSVESLGGGIGIS